MRERSTAPRAQRTRQEPVAVQALQPTSLLGQDRTLCTCTLRNPRLANHGIEQIDDVKNLLAHLHPRQRQGGQDVRRDSVQEEQREHFIQEVNLALFLR